MISFQTLHETKVIMISFKIFSPPQEVGFGIQTLAYWPCWCNSMDVIKESCLYSIMLFEIRVGDDSFRSSTNNYFSSWAHLFTGLLVLLLFRYAITLCI